MAFIFRQTKSLLLILAFLSAGSLFARDNDGLPRTQVRKGDFCIRCNTDHINITEVVLYRGRRIPVCENCQPLVFAKDSLQHYAEKQQPKGALFQESAVQSEDRPIRWGWFAGGVWVLVALLSAAVTAVVAMHKGLSSRKWFLRGLLFSIAGLAAILFRKSQQSSPLPAGLAKIPVTRSPLPCPNCGHLNHPSSTQCPQCKTDLSPQVESEVKLTSSGK